MEGTYVEKPTSHNPLVEFSNREAGKSMTLSDGEQLNPYEYKLINGVYFMRYMAGESDSTLYEGKENTFDSNHYAMSICDERGFVYVAAVQDNNVRQKIGKVLRKKGYIGFKDLDAPSFEKLDDWAGHRISGHYVPFSNEIGGLDRLIDATGRAHIFHTQFSVQDKARNALENDKGNKF